MIKVVARHLALNQVRSELASEQIGAPRPVAGELAESRDAGLHDGEASR